MITRTRLIHYRRVANIGAFASHYFWIQNHTMQIVEVDGIWTESAETEMIYVAAGQRYSVLVTMKNDTSANYPIMGSMDTTLFDTLPSTLNWNVTGWLVYDDTAGLPAMPNVSSFDPYDDFDLIPSDGEGALGTPDKIIILDLTMNNLADGAN